MESSNKSLAALSVMGTNPKQITLHPTPRLVCKTYADDQLSGGHIIKLGTGNDEAAREALAAWPGGLQIGGGIHAENAAAWLQPAQIKSS